MITNELFKIATKAPNLYEFTDRIIAIADASGIVESMFSITNRIRNTDERVFELANNAVELHWRTRPFSVELTSAFVNLGLVARDKFDESFEGQMKTKFVGDLSALQMCMLLPANNEDLFHWYKVAANIVTDILNSELQYIFHIIEGKKTEASSRSKKDGRVASLESMQRTNNKKETAK